MVTAAVAHQALSYHCGALSHNQGCTNDTASAPSRKLLNTIGPCKKYSGRHSSSFTWLSLSSSTSCRPVRHITKAALFETTTSFEIDELVGVAPTLRALCSDLDWQKAANELREEALVSLHAQPERDLILKRVEILLQQWLHDGVIDSVLQPAQLAGAQTTQEELGLLDRVEDLRLQASLQAIEELANGVDRGFDWETEVAELHHHIQRAQHLQSEQQLWHSWESARENMAEEADWLKEQAFDAQHQNVTSYTNLFSTEKREDVHSSSESQTVLEKSNGLWKLGAALAGFLGGGVMKAMGAFAADEPVSSEVVARVVKGAATVPGWVGPTVLAFPVVSYVIFSFYREKVNPYARVTDWMFGVVVTFIVANIVMIATLGVRLY